MAYLQLDEELFINTLKIKRLLVKKIRIALRIYYDSSKQWKDKNV